MRRLLALVLVGAVAATAALLPEPEPPPEPLAGVIIERPGLESPVDSAIWYCPWAQANAGRDSRIGVATIAAAEANLTFPVAIPGEPADLASVGTFGPGAAVVTLSDIAQRGDSPSLIEFTGGPASAAVTVTGEVVAADTCVAEGPDEWFFAGGSTGQGERLELRLFNPFPEVAKVTVEGFSEIGVEAFGDLRSISVNPRAWRDIEFQEDFRQRTDLVLAVRIEEGLVVPAASFASGEDEAWWAGTGLSETWEFPVAKAEGVTGAFVVVANPGPAEVDVTVDLYTPEGPQLGTFSATVPPEAPVRFDLSGIEAPVLGARVAASGRVAASVVATGEGGTALTAGAVAPARSWLLPGVTTVGRDQASLWVLNSSDEAISVTVSLLAGAEPVNTNLSIPPGSVVVVPVVDDDATGFLIESPLPFTTGWSVTGPSGTAFATALTVPDA